MPVEFTIPEVLRLAELGKFTLVSLGLDIDSTLADPLHRGAAAAGVALSVDPTERIITERYNFGDTSQPERVYYELHSEKGYYCGGVIRVSDIENHCTHLFVARFINVFFWNVTSPALDVHVDFSCWFYIFPEQNEELVREIYFKRDKLLEEIRDSVSSLKELPPPPIPRA